MVGDGAGMYRLWVEECLGCEVEWFCGCLGLVRVVMVWVFGSVVVCETLVGCIVLGVVWLVWCNMLGLVWLVCMLRVANVWWGVVKLVLG